MHLGSLSCLGPKIFGVDLFFVGAGFISSTTLVLGLTAFENLPALALA